MKLRPYQGEAWSAVETAWAAGTLRPAVLLPTGMGKTVIFASMAHAAVTERRERVGIIVHRDELATQTMEKLHDIDPTMNVGIVKAERDEWNADVVILSVQTLARTSRLTRIPPRWFQMLIVDEAHHAAADSYVRALDYFGVSIPAPIAIKAWGGAPTPNRLTPTVVGATKAVGFTATMSRDDSRGLGDIWDSIAYSKDILWGIRNGYLVDVSGRAITVDGLDLTKVVRRGGDMTDGSLGDALENSDAVHVVAAEYIDHASNPDGTLRPGIAFWPTVRVAELFTEAGNAAGIRTATVIGTTPKEERTLVYKRYREGDLDMISSVGVLTEGFDMPKAEVAVIGRATEVQGLYVQMVGRILRPYPGKARALVLDVTGVTSRMRLAGLADLSSSVDEVRDDESLTDAEERERTGRIKPKRSTTTVDGERGFDDVDLFQQSRAAWLKTYKGVWFIQTKNSLYFLWPDDEATARSESGEEKWHIGFSLANRTRGGKYLQSGMSLDYAMSIAEQFATDEDPMIASRSSSWRKKGGKASEAQTGFAASMGLDVSKMTKNDASNAISIHIVSRMLDRHVRENGS